MSQRGNRFFFTQEEEEAFCIIRDNNNLLLDKVEMRKSFSLFLTLLSRPKLYNLNAFSCSIGQLIANDHNNTITTLHLFSCLILILKEKNLFSLIFSENPAQQRQIIII